MESWTDVLKGSRLLRQALAASPEEVARQEAAHRRALEEEQARVSADYPTWAKTHYGRLSRLEVETKTFDRLVANPGNSMAAAMMQAWTPAQSAGVFMFGTPGTGKTHLLKALVNRWAAKDFRCFTGTVAEVMDMLREEMDSKVKRVADLLTLPALVALDDFGAERATEWAQVQFLTILERRLRSGLPVFMTSNLQKQELAERYDARIVDRLMEMMVFVRVEGISHRRDIYVENQKKFAK